MWKNTVERGRPQVTIRCLRIACWILIYKHTFRLCDNYFFPWRKLLQNVYHSYVIVHCLSSYIKVNNAKLWKAMSSVHLELLRETVLFGPRTPPFYKMDTVKIFCTKLNFLYRRKSQVSYTHIRLKVWRDAHGIFMYSLLHYTCSTCFGCYLRPSSGAQTAEYSCRYAWLLCVLEVG
jgi:hypothetical protein